MARARSRNERIFEFRFDCWLISPRNFYKRGVLGDEEAGEFLWSAIMARKKRTFRAVNWGRKKTLVNQVDSESSKVRGRTDVIENRLLTAARAFQEFTSFDLLLNTKLLRLFFQLELPCCSVSFFIFLYETQ